MCDDLIGKKFFRWTVIEDLGCFVKEGTTKRMYYVKCQCDCGNERVVSYNNLVAGRTKSCGCLRIETSKQNGLDSRKHNIYYTFGNTTIVKFTNANEYFICDTEDWDKLKKYSWHRNGGGYAFAYYIDGRQESMHRIVTNCPKGKVPNHITPISSGVCDNRKSNLYITTQAINAKLKGIKPSSNTSGCIGVTWDKSKNKWQASITVDGKYIFLGRYDLIDDAIKARKDGELRYWGFTLTI